MHPKLLLLISQELILFSKFYFKYPSWYQQIYNMCIDQINNTVLNKYKGTNSLDTETVL